MVKWNGIPDNPEVSGYHWIKSNDKETAQEEIIYAWDSKNSEWFYDDFSITPTAMAKVAIYLGPVAPRKESMIHRRMAYFFAGWTSTLPDWRDKHPMDSFEFVEKICIEAIEEDEKAEEEFSR